MANPTSHHDMRITDAQFCETEDRMVVLVTLEDGSKRTFTDLPKGRVYLERRNLVGHVFKAAHRRAMCWLEAADMGIHRIVDAEIRPIDPDDPTRWDWSGNWEVLVLLSNGELTRAIAYYNDELDFSEREFLDLTVEGARELKFQKDRSYISDGYHPAQLSEAWKCLAYKRVH